MKSCPSLNLSISAGTVACSLNMVMLAESKEKNALNLYVQFI